MNLQVRLVEPNTALAVFDANFGELQIRDLGMALDGLPRETSKVLLDLRCINCDKIVFLDLTEALEALGHVIETRQYHSIAFVVSGDAELQLAKFITTILRFVEGPPSLSSHLADSRAAALAWLRLRV